MQVTRIGLDIAKNVFQGLCRKVVFLGVFPLFSSPVVRGENSGMINFKGSQFEQAIILWGVRWYVAYPISYRQLEEMMRERGAVVDHSTLNRWVIKYAPEVEKQFRRRQRPVGKSWRMDETYVRIKGQWKYLYRAVLRSVPSKWWRHQGWGAKTAEVFDNLSAVEV
jgi:hypothetical protein